VGEEGLAWRLIGEWRLSYHRFDFTAGLGRRSLRPPPVEVVDVHVDDVAVGIGVGVDALRLANRLVMPRMLRLAQSAGPSGRQCTQVKACAAAATTSSCGTSRRC
jgi:hypothetical protein